MEILNINMDAITDTMLSLVIAFILPILTAWQREATARSAGLRTFPLVSIATCSFTLLAMSSFPEPEAQAKVVAGIVTGIGFIGGGAILKSNDNVSGTSTAAAIWATGAVGIAVAMGRVEIAVAVSVMTFLTFLLIGRVKKEVKTNG